MLDKPAQYVPLEKGIYEVAPGLFPLGHDFGQGSMDQKVFQLDSDFPQFAANTETCRNEDLNKYFCEKDLDPKVQTRAVRFFVEQLCREWPQHFQIEKNALNLTLKCSITSEALEFDECYQLINNTKYRSAFDALRSQIQEDFAITVADDSRDRLALLHVCGPSHWAPQDKLGKSFFDVHSPVPGIEKMAKSSQALVQAMIHKGPFVRFVWSFVTDKNLNHHPVAPFGEDPVKWKGRAFNKDSQIPFYLRVERQVTFGLPEVNAALFFIRLYFVDGVTLRNNEVWRKKLISSLHSMSAESRVYKGVSHCFDELVGWLDSPVA